MAAAGGPRLVDRCFAVRDRGDTPRVGRRTDAPGREKQIGTGGPTVSGAPLELLLWAAGRRDVARVAVA